MAKDESGPPFHMDDFTLGPSSIESGELYYDSSEHYVHQSEISFSSPESASCTSADRNGRADSVYHDVPIALGVLRLQRAAGGFALTRLVTEMTSDASLLSSQPSTWTLYSAEMAVQNTISDLITKGCLRTKLVGDAADPDSAILQLFLYPEESVHRTRISIPHCRRLIRKLLVCVDRSQESWTGSSHLEPMTSVDGFVPDGAEQGQESLFYVFNTLDSPKHRLETVIPGLKTELYPYQRRSVAEMVERESTPAKSVDPRMPLSHDQNGRPFYLNAEEGIIRCQPQLYEAARGGVLAETMGYGKTLICIAVILATLGHYPSIPEGRLAIKPLPRSRTGSLLEMAAAGAIWSGVPWKAEFKDFGNQGFFYERCVQKLQNYVCSYEQPLFRPLNPSRKGKRLSSSIVRLSSATLVVLPPNLLVQWQHEIARHTVANALDVLVLDHNTKTIPVWTELVKNDIVLITKARLEQEYRDDDLHNGKRRRSEEIFQSPLTQIRWLRVVCDEGHSFAGSSSRTNALAMLDKISVERRWMVSGTPSNSMLGVEMSLVAGETSADRSDEEAPVSPGAHRRGMKQILDRRRNPEILENEAKEMEKLRLLVVNFLKVKPWANTRGIDHANWKKYMSVSEGRGVTEPYANGDSGLVYSARSESRRRAACLRTLLQSLIVRHRIEDVDADLTLPCLHNRVVLLDPSYYDKLSMNLFILVLTSNAITSERTDEDYMFHPRNRKQLDTLVNNLRQSTFHWIGFCPEDISQSVRVSENYLDTNLDVISDQDGMLLTEAIMVGRRALADSGWRAFSLLHEIGVYVNGFPQHALEAWSIHERASSPLLLGTTQARNVQKYIGSHKTESDATTGLTGAGLRTMQMARKKAVDAEPRRKPLSKIMEEPTLRSSGGLLNSPVKRPRHNTFSEHENAEGKHEFSSQTQNGQTKTDNGTDGRDRTSQAGLNNTRIVGFSSTKLAYLIEQVMTFQSTEKIIIFYDANNVAYWIAEALELLSVQFLIYANTLAVARRATYLATFNQSDEFRVLLMDLKQAAHGLHVASASRVYIVSPIWQPNIESQAIKRAHRIGQTRPVHVETLVLKGTLEEKMMNRRRQMSETELQRAEKSLLDDVTMSQIIKDLRFLKFEPLQQGTLFNLQSAAQAAEDVSDRVARLATPQTLFGYPSRSINNPDQGLVLAKVDPGLSRASSMPPHDNGVDGPVAKKPRKAVKIVL